MTSASSDGPALAAIADDLLSPARAVAAQEVDTIARVALRFAEIFERGRRVYGFGAGHSKAVADELCYRAGGLPGFTSMNLDDLRTEPRPAHLQLSDSMPERDPANGPALLELFAVGAGDGLLIASQSGRNGAIVEMARVARERGVYVVAVVSRAHSDASVSRHPGGGRLIDYSDETIDNHGPLGDAVIRLPNGAATGSASTISGALIAQLLTVATARALLLRGQDPGIIPSANVDRSSAG
ncbi:sugar isomerase domain-containing protein [Microbacterium lushaniae]|uniref:Sugar isomerase domain-containing protein n=1 Tax=Microbacterium lushaniae TaxID=2614639 RepID=A0A5J6L7E3_9MICO|nr:sugar isomerase domain-containing protein [Microbacterium lushaniae]QEW04320.1 sugar isomerase domain-containing protein [Microbacterium lushaniae]